MDVDAPKAAASVTPAESKVGKVSECVLSHNAVYYIKMLVK